MSSRFQTTEALHHCGKVFSLTLSLTSWTSPPAGGAFCKKILRSVVMGKRINMCNPQQLYRIVAPNCMR
jgi:hypothetical protein